MMGWLFLFLLAALWFFFLCLLMKAAQTEKARVKRRFFRMLREAEADREQEPSPEARQEPLLEEEETAHRSFADRSLTERVFRPALRSLSEGLSCLAPTELRAMLEDQIFRMGKQDSWSVVHLAAVWVFSVGMGFLAALLLVRHIAGLQSPQSFMILLLGIGAGAAAPFFVLRFLIHRRQERMRRQMPDFIDLICISVQAGLSFDGAVAKITSRMKGALSEEFQRMQRDIRHGMTRQRSLTQLAKRCDIEEMYLFTASVIQSDRLGTSMGRTLKIQADNIRDRYRQSMRAEAMKAPVKIIFPMIIFIFPSIFVITLLPIALTMMHSFGK